MKSFLLRRSTPENYTDISNILEDVQLMILKTSVVVDECIDTYHLDAITMRTLTFVTQPHAIT